MNFLKKLQSFSEGKRKFILWTIVIIVGAGLLVWWGQGLGKRLQVFRAEELEKELDLPEIRKEFEEILGIAMPKIELLGNVKKEWKKLQEMIGYLAEDYQTYSEFSEITKEELKKLKGILGITEEEWKKLYETMIPAEDYQILLKEQEILLE